MSTDVQTTPKAPVVFASEVEMDLGLVPYRDLVFAGLEAARAGLDLIQDPHLKQRTTNQLMYGSMYPSKVRGEGDYAEMKDFELLENMVMNLTREKKKIIVEDYDKDKLLLVFPVPENFVAYCSPHRLADIWKLERGDMLMKMVQPCRVWRPEKGKIVQGFELHAPLVNIYRSELTTNKVSFVIEKSTSVLKEWFAGENPDTYVSTGTVWSGSHWVWFGVNRTSTTYNLYVKK